MTVKKTTKTRAQTKIKKNKVSEIIEEISDISDAIPFIESLINNRNITSKDDRKHVDPLLTLLKKRAVKKAIILSTLMNDEDD